MEESVTPSSLTLDALRAQFDGDLDILRMLAEVFLQEGPEQLDAVAQAIDRQDAAGLAHSAHKIKGSLGVFGAPRAERAALALEQAGHAGDLSTVQEPYRTLSSVVGELVALLETVPGEAA